jgi:dolichyl-phosphate-mannose--protein O-mannosyl transferase
MVCLWDFVRRRSANAFLILTFYFGSYLALALMPRALAFLYYYLPAATILSLAPVYALTRGTMPRWPLWVFVAFAGVGFVVMLPISAAFVGTSMETFNRLMLFQSWI